MVAISGFRASDIGQYGIGDLSWYTDPLFGSDWWDIPVPVGAFYDIFNPWRDPPARASVSPIRVPSPIQETTPSGVAASRDASIPAPFVIDPDFRRTETVYEDVPGGIYETNRAPTDWARVYDEYVILNAPEEDVPFHGAIDWGEIAGTVVGGLLDPFGAGAATTAYFNPPNIVASAQAVPNLGAPVTGITGGAVTMAANGACPPTGPKYGKICLATGVITPLRRRRRRRLLTSSDIKDLSALKSIVGGAALQGAVVQAVRR